MPSLKHARVQNTYEKPCAKKLTSKEAKQFLLRHAKLGDSGAKELLARFWPARRTEEITALEEEK